MAIEGPLRELGIHDVFQLLDLSRKTGVFRVVSDIRHNNGTVFFDKGAVIYAEIESNPFPLGQVLVKARRITEADLNRAREMQEGGHPGRFGQILVEIGAVTAREIDEQIIAQVQEVVFELMNWREGRFTFEEGLPQQPPYEHTVRIPTEAVLMEGARRIDEWSKIERKIPHLGVVPTLASTSEQSGEQGTLNLLASEWEILAAINGQRNVREIADELAKSEFDVAKTLFGLESAGVIVISENPRDPEQRMSMVQDVSHQITRAEQFLAEGDLEGARGRAESALSLHPDSPELHLVLGRIQRLSGRPREAESSVRKALQLDPMLTPAHRLLGDVLALQGRFSEAVEWWDRWSKLEDPVHLNGDQLEMFQRAREAAQYLEGYLKPEHE